MYNHLNKSYSNNITKFSASSFLHYKLFSSIFCLLLLLCCWSFKTLFFLYLLELVCLYFHLHFILEVYKYLCFACFPWDLLQLMRGEESLSVYTSIWIFRCTCKDRVNVNDDLLWVLVHRLYKSLIYNRDLKSWYKL